MIGDDFIAALDRLTAEWQRLAEEPPAAADLLRRAMEHGLPSMELPAPSTPVSEAQRTRCEIELVSLSGAFDEAGYRAAQPELTFRPGRGVRNFCRRGWLRLDNPSFDFDVWWYWFRYLGLEEERINPLVHYLLVGRQAGLLPLPVAAPERPSAPAGSPVRRVCLFAGYDVDGIVDDYVVDYVRELSRFADVYYLADSVMPESELAKLSGITRGAWARRHGMYDFGSFALLARELVGWDIIDGYDELLLVNDSCYLLRSLDDVFATMDARECDWWGLQATKIDFEGSPNARALTDDDVRQKAVEVEWRQVLHVHLGSYFLCLRRPAHQEPDLRRLLDSVMPQKRKGHVITKYEVGLSRVLMNSGHRFTTFVQGLYEFHPLYTGDYFGLLETGFPLLKRRFLAENNRNVPDLVNWKARVRAVVPDADVEMFERNLLRVSEHDKLQRGFGVMTREDGSVHVPELMSDEEFEHLDARTPTFDHWWGFPVCAYDHTLAGNARAVFEEIRDDPSIKKVVFTRGRPVDLPGENVVTVPLLSPEGQELAMRCGQFFIKHAPVRNMVFPLAPDRHNFVNLWHGIPLKRFGLASVDTSDDPFNERANQACRSVITSSKVDTLAMAAAFHPLPYDSMWMTGLPRMDLVLRDPSELPEDLAAQAREVVRMAAGRRLVLLLPTFKRDQADAYYKFSDDEIDWLRAWQERHGAVLGVREHMADKAHTYSRMLAPLDPLLLTSRRFPDLEVLYGAADALVTDYSSCLVDFLVTGKPVISFAYDLERYARQERGLFYDLNEVLPGPVCRTFEELAGAMDRVFDEPTAEQREDYEWKRRLFFAHLDDQNAHRVVQRVRQLYVGRSDSLESSA